MTTSSSNAIPFSIFAVMLCLVLLFGWVILGATGSRPDWTRTLEQTIESPHFKVESVTGCLQRKCRVVITSGITIMEGVMEVEMFPGSDIKPNDVVWTEQRYYEDGDGGESYYCRNGRCKDGEYTYLDMYFPALLTEVE